MNLADVILEKTNARLHGLGVHHSPFREWWASSTVHKLGW